MQCQVDQNEHFRHLLLVAFNQGSNAAKAARDICTVYGDEALAERTARRWFTRFRNGNFDLKDADRSGRPIELDESQLDQIIHEDPRLSIRELAKIIDSTPATVSRHLSAMGKVQKLGAWIPHVLSDNNRVQRFTIAGSLLACHKDTRSHKQRFLHRIITGDEKWCLYVNIKQRKQWVNRSEQPTPRVKQDLHPRRTMLCIW